MIVNYEEANTTFCHDTFPRRTLAYELAFIAITHFHVTDELQCFDLMPSPY